jgi:transcriptional regulator with XRE-family HTH domain
MLQPAKYQNSFSKALKTARRARGLSQEAFSQVSSRTYVSTLERGLRTPTINKVDELAEGLGIHPLTLLTLAYLKNGGDKETKRLTDTISNELQTILAACERSAR